MSLSLILAALWVIVSAAVAMLPMRRQYFPAAFLLFAAPALLVFIGLQHGFWIAAIGFAAFVSMFRHPLVFLVRKALGLPVKLPKELQGRKP